MAFDAKDIARIKARIPEHFQPPHEADGTLSNAFFSVDPLHEAAALHARELERHNLGMAALDNPNLAGSNVILSGSHTSAKAQRITREERKKREADQREVIEQIIAQIEARNREIAENLARLEELDAQEAALNDQIARLQRGEQLERDADGHLKNKDAEKAIREYEERYGVKVDRTDAAQLAIILRGVRDEQQKVRRDNETLIEANERDRQLAIRMGADPASISATVTKLEQSAEGQRSVDKATAEMGDDTNRRQVAETITSDHKSRDFAVDGLNKNGFFDNVAEFDAPLSDKPKPLGPT